ncbi:uncharacterized protein LOC131076693 [Cryptomeria japonica]|uniref:uncharacterized protein LOC131076693 n=1 Tax=Cryptomeria japonica TaxID=3369 RepID=UPI0027DA5013|nr:uncharacterized protein LOC131076693 [Cryptomeria japonica]
MAIRNFRKVERSSQTPPGWRLATVKEAQEYSIRHILDDWDRVRLLDGWIGGSGYYVNVQERFRPCLGYMLVVESPTPQISDADDRKALLYSEVPELSEEGRSAAFLLCCEDWNEEVLHWLLPGLDIRAIHKDDQTKAASEVVSAIARKWQDVHAKSREREREFSFDVLGMGFQESLKALTVDTKKYLRALINDENSEQGKIIDEILQELNRESDWTENFEMFQDFRLEVGDESVWYVVVENMAWQTFYILCSGLYGKVVMHSDPLLTELIHYAYSFLGKTQKEVTAAAKEADPDFKRFDEILRFSLFSYKGKPDVLSACLLRAAQKGDANLVKRLIDMDVQPSAADNLLDGSTALHQAANLKDESNGLKIAEMLLRKDETLANAVDSIKRTTLHKAAYSGKDRMCALLLHHNASLTAKDEDGFTPLHYAIEKRREEVVGVLLSAGGEDSIEGSACLMDVEDNKAKTPLDYAISVGSNESMVAWLLSVSSQPQSYFAKLEEYQPLSAYLRESSRMGYLDLVQKLLDGGADPLEGDDEGKTSLHYAAEGADEDVAWKIIEKLLFDKKQGSINWRKASAGDKYGRNVLHVAAFLGRRWPCQRLSEGNRNLIDTKDRDGQNAMFHAVAGAHDDTDVLDYLFERKEPRNHVLAKDFSQTTLLHVAAAKGNVKMVYKLLSLISTEESKKKYVGAPDVLGQTALLKAARGGHGKVVKKLLEEGANPLKERDCDGKTALHFAAQADDEQAVKIAEMLLENCKSEKQKSLLLFASAVGISFPVSSRLEEYLKQEKTKIEKTIGLGNSLRVAATLGDTDMTLECVTRGANIALIRNDQWITTLSEDEKKNVEDVLSQIKTLVEQGTDKPAVEDNLGRSPFAIGLSALFLNPFVKSPVTVGISGEWGMGKSSVMLQTESNLLKAASQLAFSKSFKKDSLFGAGESELSIIGKGKRRKIAYAIERFERRDDPGINENIGMSIKRVKNFTAKVSKTIFEKSKKQAAEQADSKNPSKVNNLSEKQATASEVTDTHISSGFPSRFRKFWSKLRALWEESAPFDLPKFNEFLGGKYELKHHQIFKSLAVIDRRDMFEQEEASGSGNQMVSEMPWEEYSLQGNTPSILTVQYNAWHYRDETEAWAGLAVEITKELEATMTVAHKLRTSWIYNWINRRDIICLNVIFPFILALLVAIFLTIIVWLVFDTAHNKDIKKLKYGGLPTSMIVFAWGLGKLVISFVKPISSQVVDYICLPDHRQKLGYQKQVISDINFLKKNLSYKFSWKWEAFAFIWCCITWRWKDNYVPGTKIPKMPPASGNKLRMIVFVDDLDRCEENVILQVLSAVNLVLAACEINVILSMEKSMIQRAILRKYGNIKNKDNKSNEELAEKYLRKIVQLPLHLPDPSDSESSDFLKWQLGMWDSIHGSTGLAEETEKNTAHECNKLNPKFQISTPPPLEKFKQGREARKEYFRECVAKIRRDLAKSENGRRSISGVEDATTETDETTDSEHSIDEEGTGSGVEEETTEIHETTDREHAIDEEGAGIVKRDTPGIEKAGEYIIQIYRAF